MANASRGLVLGLALGFIGGALAGAGGYALYEQRQAHAWTALAADWRRLPGQEPAGALPQTFAVPPRAWDYGAMTRALPQGLAGETVLLRLTTADAQGPVAVSLAKPDGSALLSKERLLPAGPGPQVTYFRLPTDQPAAVLVRNYNAQGQGGSLSVRALDRAAEADLKGKAKTAVEAAGVY